MNNLIEHPPHSPQIISWVTLWKNNWRYSHWLICSTMTTILSSECYNILIAIYPNFLLNLYANLGLQSLVLTNLMTCASILGIGLLSGFLIYGLHLALLAIKLSYRSLQPVMRLWEQSPDLKIFLDTLLSQEHFIKLSEFLAEINLPPSFRLFLNQKQHDKDILHIFEILTELWSIEAPNEKIKYLTLKILNDWQSDKDFKIQIERIHHLIQLLIKISRINAELFHHALDETETLETHLNALSQVSNEQDILSLLIEHPEILPFYSAYRDLDEVRSGHSHLSHEEFCRNFLHPQGIIPSWLREHFSADANHYAQLWQLSYTLENLSVLEPIIDFMNRNSFYHSLIQDFEFSKIFLETFHQAEIAHHSVTAEFYQNLKTLCAEETLGDFCQIIFLLAHANIFDLRALNEVILLNNLEKVKNVLRENEALSSEDFIDNLRTVSGIIEIQHEPPLTMTPIEPRTPQVRAIQPRPEGCWSQFFRPFNCQARPDVVPHHALGHK